jgi:glucose-6-phosphate isomerase
VIERRLADLHGCFQDLAAFERSLQRENALVYSVSSVETADGAGDLHYGLGRIQPGMVGDEYFLTKGHLHAWRDAAEVYIGIAGDGLMLLEDETTGEARMLRLRPHDIVYVPGYTAHRTVNTGQAPLVYLGVYPARAGHDYGTNRAAIISHAVVKTESGPKLLKRR